jgi:hypothetical protein
MQSKNGDHQDILAAKKFYQSLYRVVWERLEKYMSLFSTGGLTISYTTLFNMDDICIFNKKLLFCSMILFLFSLCCCFLIVILDFYINFVRKNAIQELDDKSELCNIKVAEQKGDGWARVQYVLGGLSIISIGLGIWEGVRFSLNILL